MIQRTQPSAMPHGSPAEAPQPPATQYRIRDLLLIMLGLGVILGLGRALGGSVGPQEAVLLSAAVLYIVLAAVFIHRRFIWAAFVGVSFFTMAVLTPASPLVRFAMGSLLAVHLLFAGMPVLAVGVHPARWRWATVAAGVQLAAAAFTPADAALFVGAAALLSWSLAAAALGWRYRRLLAETRGFKE